MQDILGENLSKLKGLRARRIRMMVILLALSLVVSLDVFWTLRQPGLTLAGNADCNIQEHTHDPNCQNPCPLEEHVHSLTCYADPEADVETPLDWKKMFADYPYTGKLRQDLVGIAKMQVGYTESPRNFAVGDDGNRRGYTRYGAWYGTPYRDWSAMFVSYCLHYAGADETQYPGNTGGAAMAELWKKQGKYETFGDYTPVSGDLVFFKDSTVGIVTEVYNATFYALRGDREDAVRGDRIHLKDATIAGWGRTGPKAAPQAAVRPGKEQLAACRRPTIYIIEGGSTPTPVRRHPTRNGGITQLLPYLEANGGNYFYTLLDFENHELPKDENGNYVVQADVGYKLTISFASPEGFLPGTYQYQVPNGLLVDGGEGTFILKDGTNVGSWVVTDEGLVTLYFNEQMNSRSDITISATLGIHFPAQDDPIDFDGKITVTVEKPSVEVPTTEVYKWGSQGNEAAGTDPSKIYWTAYIVGKEGSNIPGSVLTDKVLLGDYLGEHYYTESDMAKGLTIGISEYDPVTGAAGNWHSYTVYPGDPNLTWTAEGWSYNIPESVRCIWCGDVTLGNHGWEYYVEYSSTPKQSTVVGAMGYMNHVTVDGKSTDGWAEFVQGEILAEVFKLGTFRGDASGGVFAWELQTVIPGREEGKKSDYFWYLMDYMEVRTAGDDLVAYLENDAIHSTVTAEHNGTAVTVPRVQDATANDLFAWDPYWSADHGDGIYNTRQLNLLCRCQCNAENCQFWNGHSCESAYWFEGDDGYWYTNGFCQCWTVTGPTVFTFTYETTDLAAVEKYGGMDNRLRNLAVLYNKILSPNGTISGMQVADATARVPIPGLFEKKLTHDFNGYTANYRITVNEAKLVLTDGSPLTIRDEMTQTLTYISGSLVITAEDAAGHVTTLEQGVDYTVSYDGTGNHTDANGKPIHLLEIVVLHPQPVMYILDYDTTLIIPSGTTQAVKYSNSATITLWGENITDSSTEKVYADINIAAKSYKVQMFKTCAQTGAPLGGATFGLYNEHGGLITSDVTNASGQLLFQTNLIEGIVLREHILYYMQEIEAPPGYRLDETQYWFCFCDTHSENCPECQRVLGNTAGVRIPFEQIGKIHITNELLSYDLPATGGSGVYPLILVSVVFITIPLVYRFIQRRKRERRGVG